MYLLFSFQGINDNSGYIETVYGIDTVYGISTLESDHPLPTRDGSLIFKVLTIFFEKILILMTCTICEAISD